MRVFRLLALNIRDLSVSQFMTAYPISVNPDVSFETVVDFMVRHKIGNLIVMDGGTPQGIFSEREILQSLLEGKPKYQMKVSDIGMQPFSKIKPDSSILEATKVIAKEKSRPLVFDGNKLVGIITSTDLVRAFRLTSGQVSLDNVIRTDLCTCKAHDSVLDAIKIMDEKNVGSVVIDNITNYGIFTERDLIESVLAKHIYLGNYVEFHCSRPLIIAKEGILANQASDVMAAHNIKRLGIEKNQKLMGIVTARDIVEAFERLN